MKKKLSIGIAMVLLIALVVGCVGCSTKSLIDKNIQLLEKYADKYEKAYKANDQDPLEELFEPVYTVMATLEEHKDEMTEEQKKRVAKIVDHVASLQWHTKTIVYDWRYKTMWLYLLIQPWWFILSYLFLIHLFTMGLFGFDVLSDFVMPLAGKLTNVQGKSID